MWSGWPYALASLPRLSQRAAAHLPTLHAHDQVFDVRMGARMLASVPFAPGPALLRFHPRFSSTLLLGSASGAFTLADAQGMSGV